MAFVYILQSQKNGKYYVGSTDNIDQRLYQHKSGKVHTTQRLLSIELKLKQEYPNIQIAKKVERKIKNLKRRDYIQNMISDGYIKMS